MLGEAGHAPDAVAVVSDSGTIFDRTRTPLTVGFLPVGILLLAKMGSGAELETDLGDRLLPDGLGYPSSLAVCAVRPNREHLCGKVEVDETYLEAKKLGFQEAVQKGRSPECIAIETPPKGFGRCRMAPVAVLPQNRFT